MEFNTESILLQDNRIGPAFLVVDGVITQINDAAKQRSITAGTPIDSLIAVGAEEYRKFRSGKLYLQLNIGGVSTGSYVTKLSDGHLFCLNSAYQTPELRVLALAAQHLRSPLSSAMLNADQLQNNPALLENPQAKQQLSQLSRGLYQLLRAVSNMSDASGVYIQPEQQTLRNATAVFDDLMKKASLTLHQANRELLFKNLQKPVQCPLDVNLLERAVLNLISNAVKFSQDGSTISASLRFQSNRLIFTIENSGIAGAPSQMQTAFNHFLREPGLDGHPYGIGLGMSIVLSAAASHGGTVLFNNNRGNGAKVALTIATNRTPPAILESPLYFVGGYTGGFDAFLVELSDILPDSAYE